MVSFLADVFFHRHYDRVFYGIYEQYGLPIGATSVCNDPVFRCEHENVLLAILINRIASKQTGFDDKNLGFKLTFSLDDLSFFDVYLFQDGGV